MSEAAHYIEHGWALCNIPPGTKGGEEMAGGWNKPQAAIRDARKLREGWNVGLLHVSSGTCAIDVDDYQAAREFLLGEGVNLDALLAADDAVQIKSGREGRAKLLYRVPESIDPLTLVHVGIMLLDSTRKLLELRCATAAGLTVQDVLPPSIHPATGKPYTWAGDWRNLPELPAAILALWERLRETPKQRRARGAVGPGTSAEVKDAGRRLEAAGLKPYWTGHGYRSHCPHHFGESGTTLSVDEGAGGKALFHCFAGCSQQQVLDALNGKAPRDHSVPTISEAEQVARAETARKVASAPVGGRVILPAMPEELLALPGGLGELQAWIVGYMSHPSPGAAGVAALATMSHFAMSHLGIASRDGLGLNEQYLLLAPTGFGKEDLRKPIRKIAEALPDRLPRTAGNLTMQRLPEVRENAPASLQGMHSALELNRAHTFLPDEFGEWQAHTAKDGHKQQAAAYAMQAYTKAFGILEAPAVSTHGNARPYTPVKNPRVLIFATSTAERMLEAVTASQADSGGLNRFVILVAEQERIAKRYPSAKASDYVPPDAVLDLVAWVATLDEQLLSLEPEAWEYHDAHDAAVLEELAYRDPRLAKRLNEQALKLAGLVALGERRLTVTARDLAIAYAIREGLYHRAAALVGYDGALSGMHPTGRALEQIRQHLVSKPHVYRSHLPKVSRKFAGLSLPEREAVLRAVQNEGFAKLDGGKLVSLIHEEGAA